MGRPASPELSPPMRRPTDRLDFGEEIDDILFMGSALIIIARAGRVGVWNAATKSWQVRAPCVRRAKT